MRGQILVPAAAALLAAGIGGASAQGAIEETLDELGPAVRPVQVRAVLPQRVDLSATLPPPRSQGGTKSCTSWSTVYGAATQAYRRAHPGAPALSPSFSYNQVSNDPYCQSGTRISSTLNLLRDVGALPLDDYAFDAGWCGRRPTAAERAEAARYRIKSWRALDGSKLDQIRTELAEGRAVIFSLGAGYAMRYESGTVTLAENPQGKTGHAMVAVGYDDARRAMRIQNSWGRGWGEGGYAWLGYDDWREKIKAAYVID
jgi:hypothetical protein